MRGLSEYSDIRQNLERNHAHKCRVIYRISAIMRGSCSKRYPKWLDFLSAMFSTRTSHRHVVIWASGLERKYQTCITSCAV